MDYYNHYKLSFDLGFSPKKDPFSSFNSSELKLLDEIAVTFTEKIKIRKFSLELTSLPELNVDGLNDELELERAYLLYSTFAHGFVWETFEYRDYLPKNIVTPWLKICSKLKRLPILTYNSIVMHNWRRIDPSKGISLGNLNTLIQFFNMNYFWRKLNRHLRFQAGQKIMNKLSRFATIVSKRPKFLDKSILKWLPITLLAKKQTMVWVKLELEEQIQLCSLNLFLTMQLIQEKNNFTS
jgi:hypothetical protein